MAEKTNNGKIADKPAEVSLKTPSEFQRQSNCQQQQSCNDFDGNIVTTCFSNIIVKFTMNQAYIMGSFLKVLKDII